MTNTRHTILGLGALALLAGIARVAPAAAQASSQDTVRLELVVGNQTVENVSARGLARFNEFRTVPDGPVLEFGHLAWAPAGKGWTMSLTAVDAFQSDQRYLLQWADPARFSIRASYTELPRFYSSGSTTLWSGIGTGTLTLSDAFRQATETAAGAATAPAAASALTALMNDALTTSVRSLDLRTQRNAAMAALEFKLSSAFSLAVTGRSETRTGSKPLGFGTYIRRQALAGVPGTGAGNFWRETIEARGLELVEPLDHRTTEVATTVSWTRKGHSASVGWQGSWFRNDITALYFDNPFEGVVGRASATTFNPASDQEPAAPFGNNNLRGLTGRSVMQLWPDNNHHRIFGNASVRLGGRTRLSTTLSSVILTQNDPFLPYAENDQVVFSGVAGQPGVVYAKDAPLPQSSLDGKMGIVQADVRLTSRITAALSARAAYRFYDLNDDRPEIDFPGYSSSGDSYFRRSIGQTDASGARVLLNELGGYRRQRMSAGAAYRFGWITLDGEVARLIWDYDARQVDKTTDDSFKGSIRVHSSDVTINAHYVMANRDYEGVYDVGLELSGVRAYDVWSRDRDQVGADVDLPVTADLALSAGASYVKDLYAGAVDTFSYGYGLQDTKSGSVFGGFHWSRSDWSFGAWGGFDTYERDNLQVTKTSLTTDYNATNRWSRGASDNVFWIGLDVDGRILNQTSVRAAANYQRFSGSWETINLATPDVNSAVAYPFPDQDESTFSARLSLLRQLTAKLDFELRYLYEPYRLTDFTWDILRPYGQGVFKETRSSATDVGDMNVSRMLWLDSRYGSYTAHVLSFLLHLRL